MKPVFTLFFLLLLILDIHPVRAQDSDTEYRQPLSEVLRQIEQQFGIKIKAAPALLEGRWVRYAQWRFRDSLAQTLDHVLTPLDLEVTLEKEKVYKLKAYEYYRWEPREGWDKLNRLAAATPDPESWARRRALLKPALLEALGLSPLPPSPGSRPVQGPIRKMNGYTVQNIALEILPGVYVSGSLYRPARYRGKIPVMLSPDGHWEGQRYRPDCQLRCAMLARMGSMAFSYDLFAWGESLLQFKPEDHRRSIAHTMQTLAGIRILDYLLSLPDADPARTGISGGSGAGSHTVLLTALDERIRLAAPVVSLSSWFYGGCPCESGKPIHLCGGGTNNVELAAMAAPRPQLVVTDGKDWTKNFPEHDLPYLQQIYGYYGKPDQVVNVHLPAEGHDFGPSKRKALYDFLVSAFRLSNTGLVRPDGTYDESGVTLEQPAALCVFGEKGEKLPAHALHGIAALEAFFPPAKNN